MLQTRNFNIAKSAAIGAIVFVLVMGVVSQIEEKSIRLITIALVGVFALRGMIALSSMKRQPFAYIAGGISIVIIAFLANRLGIEGS